MKEEQIYLKNLSSIPNIEIIIDTNWLFVNSMKEDMNISDVVIRYLVIEEYYLKSDLDIEKMLNSIKENLSYENILTLGFPMLALYYQMQYKRAEYIKKISSIDVSSSLYTFINLIKKVDVEGFNINYPLEINQDFYLLDGAHRLALALYHKIPRIKIFFNNGLNFTPDYSIKWFEDRQMKEHVKEINKNYKKILEKNSLIYLIETNDEINQYTIDKNFFIERIKSLPSNKKWQLLTKEQKEKDVYYKLISKFNQDKNCYPKYTENVNLPRIVNDYEEQLINWCNSNDIILLKEKGELSVQ